MKKAIVFILFSIFGKTFSQNYLSPDTARQHEISVSVLPIINFVSGSFEGSGYTNFNFGYKYYLKNKLVFRTAFVLFPHGYNRSHTEGMVIYHSTVGNKNIFYTEQASGSVKSQINIGLEKNYKYNRLIHGVGVDAFINHSRVTYQTNYFYRYTNQSLVWSSVSDTVNYSVDSLGSGHTLKKVGCGLQVFYSVKYQISKRWYVSATVGPSVNLSFIKVFMYENETKQSSNFRVNQLDFPNVGLISDISICFRL